MNNNGGWKDPDTGKVYNDENVTYYVICEDDFKNREVLTNLRNFEERFQQNEIMMFAAK
jgi:hypothetical protein